MSLHSESPDADERRSSEASRDNAELGVSPTASFESALSSSPASTSTVEQVTPTTTSRTAVYRPSLAPITGRPPVTQQYVPTTGTTSAVGAFRERAAQVRQEVTYRPPPELPVFPEFGRRHSEGTLPTHSPTRPPPQPPQAPTAFVSYSADATTVLLRNQFPHDTTLAQRLCSPGKYLLTGPTGVGKSTWALQPLKCAGRRILVVQPTLVNARNFHREHTSMPSRQSQTHWASWYNNRKPTLFLSFQQAPTDFDVITADYLVAMLQADPLFLTDYDCFVVDEAHVLTPAQQFINYYLRAKVEHLIFISATPEATMIARRTFATKVVTDLDVSEEAVDTNLLASAWNPANTGTRTHNRRLAFVKDLPTAQHIKEVFDRHNHLSVIIDTNDAAAYDLATELCKKNSCLTVLVTPSASDGITLPIDVIIDPATVTGKVLENAVVRNRKRGTTEAEREQRHGRAGRISRGVIYTVPGDRPNIQSHLMDADALTVNLLCRAFGAPEPYTISDPRYNRVLQLASSRRIRAALAAPGSLYNNVFKFDANGLPYVEFAQYGDAASPDDFLTTHCTELRGFLTGDNHFHLQFCFDTTLEQPIDFDMEAVAQLDYERAVGEYLIRHGAITVPRDPRDVATIIFGAWNDFVLELDTVFEKYKTPTLRKWKVSADGATEDERTTNRRATFNRWKQVDENEGAAMALAEILGDRALRPYLATRRVQLRWSDTDLSVSVSYMGGGLSFEQRSGFINRAIYSSLVEVTADTFKYYVMRDHAAKNPEEYYQEVPDWPPRQDTLRLVGGASGFWFKARKLLNKLQHALNGNQAHRRLGGFGPNQPQGQPQPLFPGVGRPLVQPVDGFGAQNVRAPPRPGERVLSLLQVDRNSLPQLTPMAPSAGTLNPYEVETLEAAIADHFGGANPARVLAALTMHFVEYDASPEPTHHTLPIGDIEVDFDVFFTSLSKVPTRKGKCGITKRRIADMLGPGMKDIWDNTQACAALKEIGTPRARKANIPPELSWCATSFATAMSPSSAEMVFIRHYQSTTLVKKDNRAGLRNNLTEVGGGADQHLQGQPPHYYE
jgi:hypothetical protein